MIDREPLSRIALVFMLVDLAMCGAYYRFAFPAWITRNFGRFITVLFFVLGLGTTVGLIITSYSTLIGIGDVLVGTLRLWRWNLPKDDEPPRRKRAQKKAEKKEGGLDWTGAAAPAGAT